MLSSHQSSDEGLFEYDSNFPEHFIKKHCWLWECTLDRQKYSFTLSLFKSLADYPRPELAFEISLEIEDPTESEPTGPYSTVNDPQISHFDTLNEDAPDDLQALDTNEIPDSDMNISSEMINCMEIPQESALEVMDDSVQETINDFPEQTMEDPVQSTADEPTLETIDKEVHHSPDVNDSLDEPSRPL